MTDGCSVGVTLDSVSTLSDEFSQFEASPPPELFGDPIWRLPAYRIAEFLADVVDRDIPILFRAGCSSFRVSQLERAVDSIGANITEGYSRYSGRERARFYEIALGSAREARSWYRRVTRFLPEGAALERAFLLTRAIKILKVAIPQERSSSSERRIRRSPGDVAPPWQGLDTHQRPPSTRRPTKQPAATASRKQNSSK